MQWLPQNQIYTYRMKFSYRYKACMRALILSKKKGTKYKHDNNITIYNKYNI